MFQFEYEPGNQVLNDINFSCQPGQGKFALLGSTGSGKNLSGKSFTAIL